MGELIINLEDKYAILELQDDCFELFLNSNYFFMRHHRRDIEPVESKFTKDELITKTDLHPLVKWAGKGLLGIPK